MASAALMVLVAAASGCSDASPDDGTGPQARDEPAASTSSPEAEPAATIADVCSAISPAMQRIPGRGPYEEIVTVLEPVVSAGGDTAVVFEGLHEAASDAVETIGTIEYLDVEAEFDSLIPGVASTCESAGVPL